MDFKRKIYSLRDTALTVDLTKIYSMAMSALLFLMLFTSIFMLFSDVCFANDIFTAGAEIGKSIYKSIAGISTVLAGVGIAIAACMYFFSPDERTVASAKGWMVRIVLAWLIINCVGLLLTTVKNLTSGYTSQDLSGF